MKKILLLFLCALIIPLISCVDNILDEIGNETLQTDVENDLIEYYIEKNGDDALKMFKNQFFKEGKFVIEEYSTVYEIKFKRLLLINSSIVFYECHSEEEAEEGCRFLNECSISAKTEGRIILTQEFMAAHVLVYGLDSIHGDGINEDMWFYDEKKNHKILFRLAKNTPIINNTLTISGYDEIAQHMLYHFMNTKLDKIIISDDVKIVQPGALVTIFCRVIEFGKNVTTIHMGNVTNSNQTFEYTVIPEGVTYLGTKAFSKGNIFCEINRTQKPSNWKPEYLTGTAKIYWKGQWEYNENGVPQPIK